MVWKEEWADKRDFKRKQGFVRLCQMATYLYNKKFHRNKTVTFDWLLLLHNHCHSYK
jgi:hypothetical protein